MRIACLTVASTCFAGENTGFMKRHGRAPAKRLTPFQLVQLKSSNDRSVAFWDLKRSSSNALLIGSSPTRVFPWPENTDAWPSPMGFCAVGASAKRKYSKTTLADPNNPIRLAQTLAVLTALNFPFHPWRK
jgi:hypothetical protein